MAGITFYIAHYGYAAMYFLLALGILGIPVPDETLIVAFGGMAARGSSTLPARWPSLFWEA